MRIFCSECGNELFPDKGAIIHVDRITNEDETFTDVKLVYCSDCDDTVVEVLWGDDDTRRNLQ